MTITKPNEANIMNTVLCNTLGGHNFIMNIKLNVCTLLTSSCAIPVTTVILWKQLEMVNYI